MAAISLDVKSRTPFAGSVPFGPVGPYEVIEGVARYAFDPAAAPNAPITDLGLAPRDRHGLVECEGDVRILRPTDPARGQRRLLADIINRGNSVAAGMFNNAGRGGARGAGEPGNGFLMRHGFTVLQCGWQFDVAPGTALGLRVPDALQDGKPLTGKITYTFQPNKPTRTEELFTGIHNRSLPNDVESKDAVLTVRDYESDPPTVIPRDQWLFAKTVDGRAVPDPAFLYLESGFVPGKVYQVTYPTTGAHIAGVGLIATRDMVSFLRHGTAAQGNPCAGELDHTYAFGVSQTGRFLRLFLYLGLNLDEQGRQVFDGVLAHIGGGRMAEFNKRFPQLNSSSKRTLSYLFPYLDTDQRDPVSGKVDSILARHRAKGGLPKVFLTNTAAEYYGSLGSLVHTNVEGTRDVAPSRDVRIYQISGAQHGSGSLPLTDSGGEGAKLQQLVNIVDYRPFLRAALLDLADWVAKGAEPPPSTHPLVVDGTLVKSATLASFFNSVPGVRYPERLRALTPSDYQAGLDPAQANHTGGGDPLPVGTAFTNLVAAVDRDGNEVGGVRLPDLTVPLATHAGWNVRHRDIGGGNQMIGLTGSTIPFPATRAQRLASGDPRASIEERYASREAYLALVRKAAEGLVAQRFMLAEDVDHVVQQAGLRYDAILARAAGTAAPAPVRA
ncbi:MAG: hypothetical protein HY681_04710 [Chloroflexi bacterium]|nr:hypothetical protein [Chloroflexota bacterium]